ncbi:hypothetical protein FEM55_23135 [Dyadobacter sediminis]|uniref:Uncharacterized protein n=2 Tax=Dyadobacter sediminis TaxID=1493691 RepID=A0A5R9K5P7_9BACT|nr:hypothetical protein FEM55_23135 [Dyadobacter sediminis]
MNKSVLLRLYERKDPKRKRMLYDLFKDRITMNASLSMIAELINQELGEKDLVQAADIKYCRHYFNGKINGSDPVKEIGRSLTKPPLIDLNLSKPSTPANVQDISWTDPDENNTSSNFPRKSKFSNK